MLIKYAFTHLNLHLLKLHKTINVHSTTYASKVETWKQHENSNVCGCDIIRFNIIASVCY